MTIFQDDLRTSEQIRPIQLLERGKQTLAPAPFLRITACGLLTMEVVAEVVSTDPPQARYLAFTPDQLRGRGTAPALTLLKLLLSRSERFALRDWLIEQFCHDRDVFSSVRLDNIVSQLRSLLCPPAYEDLRTQVVAHVRGSASSGDGYQLAAYPLIWTDIDALTWNVEQAARMERFGDDPLPYWERAYALARRGIFLPDELYSDWAAARRGEVAGMLRQGVQALARLYLARHGEAGEEEALLLLRSYWQEHPREEDVLRPLMELLARRECYQEALEYYAHAEKLLAEDGIEPDPRTRDLAEYVRTKQIQRQQSVQRFVSAPPALQAPPTVPGTIEIALEENPAANALPAPETELQAVQTDTRHLIGREAWIATITQMVQARLPKKLIVLQGPVGVGKSSELHRLADAFRRAEHASCTVIWFALPAAEWDGTPETALDVFLGTFLAEYGLASLPADLPREKRLTSLLNHLEHHQNQTVILLDNAECLFGENGQLAPCWEAFLVRFVRSRHQATLLLATKEWRGWPGREGIFVAETFVPPLTLAESTALLQRLGLDAVPVEHLHTISERMAGIPLLLEWTAKLIHDPLLFDDWQSFADDGEGLHHPDSADLTSRLARLLEDPTLLGAHLAHRLTPLLQRIIEKHLSTEARKVLERLAVVTIPLGKPALQVLCPRPALLKELRDASLLARYTNRVQLLPVVAATVCQQLSSEQRQEAEELAIQAYTRWLDEGNLEMREAGSVVTELAALLFAHQQLQRTTLLLLHYGWLSFNAGFGARLAQLAQKMLHRMNWHDTTEEECSGLLLVNTLFPFRGQSVASREYINYQRISEAFHNENRNLALPLEIEDAVLHTLLVDATNDLRFEEAQALLDAYRSRLEKRHIAQPDQYPTLHQEQALLYKKWGSYFEEQKETGKARMMRERVITLHQQVIHLLSAQKETSPLKESLHKRRLAYHLNNLGYNLNRAGRYEEALQVIERAVTLREQGYGYPGTLAASYGEKSQILMELGRFQEALLFDEKAVAEIRRCAEAGDRLSQEEKWIYQVNRGRLYLRVGRVDEAEQLLREALPHIHVRRRLYRMLAKEALEEIAQARRQTQTPRPQLDWRWVERFRELESYDSYWWLTWAGPFTEEEQQRWDQLSALPLDETTKAQLGELMKVSRERELAAAIAEQREPRLFYPAIDIEEIRHRIAEQHRLDLDIQQSEPNAIVRRLYHGAIEEELDYLHLIEATYEQDTEKFWLHCRRLDHIPTREEMIEALAPVRRILRQGFASTTASDIAQQFQEFLLTQVHLPSDLLLGEHTLSEELQRVAEIDSSPRHHISAQAARRFFETVLRVSGYEGWHVTIDPNAINTRIERGARTIFLEDRRFWLSEIEHIFIHELAGHVARRVAGERSSLGLLGLGTKNALPTHEGVALYNEVQILKARGQHYDFSSMQLHTVALGLACGVVSPPQTFLSLYTFYKFQTLLHYLLNYPDLAREKAQEQAHAYALNRCLRKYRGVPDLTKPGICYLADSAYLHGFHLVEQAVAEDASILDRLAVGVCTLDDLPDLQELGIVSTPQPLKKLAYTSDLDTYILSFEDRPDDESLSSREMN